MEHLLSKQFTERLKGIIAKYKTITNKGITKALGYSTDKSLNDQLKGASQPAWERTCDLLEYLSKFGITADMMFNHDTVIPKTEDSKEYQKLKQDYDRLEKSYGKIFRILKQYETILSVCHNLTLPQLNTLETLMSQDAFINSLHDIRVHATRIPEIYKELREKYLCKPYYFDYQNNVDTLLQQTIYSLRNKFIQEQRNKSKGKWSDNRKRHIEKGKKKYAKVDGRSSESDQYMKIYIDNLSEEAYMYSDEYLKKKFGNIYSDLVSK